VSGVGVHFVSLCRVRRRNRRGRLSPRLIESSRSTTHCLCPHVLPYYRPHNDCVCPCVRVCVCTSVIVPLADTSKPLITWTVPPHTHLPHLDFAEVRTKSLCCALSSYKCCWRHHVNAWAQCLGSLSKLQLRKCVVLDINAPCSIRRCVRVVP